MLSLQVLTLALATLQLLSAQPTPDTCQKQLYLNSEDLYVFHATDLFPNIDTNSDTFAQLSSDNPAFKINSFIEPSGPQGGLGSISTFGDIQLTSCHSPKSKNQNISAICQVTKEQSAVLQFSAKDGPLKPIGIFQSTTVTQPIDHYFDFNKNGTGMALLLQYKAKSGSSGTPILQFASQVGTESSEEFDIPITQGDWSSSFKIVDTQSTLVNEQEGTNTPILAVFNQKTRISTKTGSTLITLVSMDGTAAGSLEMKPHIDQSTFKGFKYIQFDLKSLTLFLNYYTNSGDNIKYMACDYTLTTTDKNEIDTKVTKCSDVPSTPSDIKSGLVAYTSKKFVILNESTKKVTSCLLSGTGSSSTMSNCIDSEISVPDFSDISPTLNSLILDKFTISETDNSVAFYYSINGYQYASIYAIDPNTSSDSSNQVPPTFQIYSDNGATGIIQDSKDLVILKSKTFSHYSVSQNDFKVEVRPLDAKLDKENTTQATITLQVMNQAT